MAPAFVVQSPSLPATFAERGVCVPFTTPALAATRARMGAAMKPEFVVPNPAGGRGFYVLCSKSIQDFCRPTVHDRVLLKAIGAARELTPSRIRQLAREVASAGFAGRQARDRAAQSAQEERDVERLTNHALLLKLVSQAERSTGVLDPAADLPVRARRALAFVTAELGSDLDPVAALSGLATMLQNVGLGACAPKAVVPRLLAELVAFQQELERWNGMGGGFELAETLGASARLAIRCTELALRQAHSLPEAMTRLIAQWRADPAEPAARAARADWLLDGWEPICLLWKDARERSGEQVALLEAVRLVPSFPRELGAWIDPKAEAEAAELFRRLAATKTKVPFDGLEADAVARNERLRAMAA